MLLAHGVTWNIIFQMCIHLPSTNLTWFPDARIFHCYSVRIVVQEGQYVSVPVLHMARTCTLETKRFQRRPRRPQEVNGG